MEQKRYASMDELIAEIKGMSIDEIDAEPWEGPRVFTVDVLRAAGALDVPAAWRKTLGGESDLFSDLDEDAAPGSEEPAGESASPGEPLASADESMPASRSGRRRRQGESSPKRVRRTPLK